MKFQFISFFIILTVFIIGCKTKSAINKTEPSTYRFGFYNVENLFDLKDHPKKADEDFTPKGKQKWTNERYEKKLSQIARVIEGMEFPTILGLCEVENELVMKALCAQSNLAAFDYETVHFESPDFRGIDVGLIYQKKQFQVIESEVIPINFPKKVVENYTTRDILWVKGFFAKKDTFHIFVNHWPSRRGGLEKSEPKRLYVAEQLHKKIDLILSKNPNSNILIMGDFNDEPTNNSIKKVLQDNDLYNCFRELDAQNEGSYLYRGNWNMLDQMMVSKNLNDVDTKWHIENASIFREDWLFYIDKKYGQKPNRTYGGSRYFGGFSDHLPIFIDLAR